MSHPHLEAPFRLTHDVPFTEANYNKAKNRYGLNIVFGVSLYDSSQARIDKMWYLADKYDLYILLWALFNPAKREELILANKDQPHLFGWFLYDEPCCGEVDKQRQINAYNEINGYDPDHPKVSSFGEGETGTYYEPTAFDVMLAYAIYPCGQSDPLNYLYTRLVTLGRHNYIIDALSKGKTWLPIFHCFDDWAEPPTWSWCAECGTINSPTHPEYNGMPGLRAMYEMYKDEVGVTPDGADYYHYYDFSRTRTCQLVMQQQIRDLNYTVLGAPLSLSGSLTFEKGFEWKVAVVKIGKLLYGSVGFVSSLAKGLSYPVSGNLRFSGPFGLTYTQLEALTWTQVQNYTWKSLGARRLYIKFLQPKLTAALSFAGSLSTDLTELIKKSLAGVLSFAGAVSHNFKLFLAGDLDLTALINLKVKRVLSGLLSPSGWFFASTICLRACEKDWTFVEGLTWTEFEEYTWCKSILKAIHLGGSLSPSGILPMKALSSFGGTLTSVGSSIFKVKPILAGVLTSSGVFGLVHIKRLLLGAISPSGVLKRLIKFPLSGVLSFSGSAFRAALSLENLFRKLIQLIQTKD